MLKSDSPMNGYTYSMRSIGGVVLVSKADSDIIPSSMDTLNRLLRREDLAASPKVPKHAIAGDVLAIASALCYAIYTLLFKVSLAILNDAWLTGSNRLRQGTSLGYRKSIPIPEITSADYDGRMTLFFGFVGVCGSLDLAMSPAFH